jgi:SAM-dependent methyltransferase
MFFPDRIQGIKSGHRVLEIGPGTSPYYRSDVLLERRYEDDREHARQCGGMPASIADSRSVYYDGDIFPFDDGAFDYVICSHVIEHVDNIETFVSEMFRVARSGYMEYPLIYYDYVFDIPEHVNILMKRGDDLVYCKKNEIFSEALKPVQKLWYAALASGHTGTASDLLSVTMQGFEWHKPFNVRKTDDVSELLWDSYEIPRKQETSRTLTGVLLGKIKKLTR